MSKTSQEWYLAAKKARPGDQSAAIDWVGVVDWLSMQCSRLDADLDQARADRDHNEQVIIRLQSENRNLKSLVSPVGTNHFPCNVKAGEWYWAALKDAAGNWSRELGQVRLEGHGWIFDGVATGIRSLRTMEDASYGEHWFGPVAAPPVPPSK